MTSNGVCDERFAAVRAELDGRLASGDELGAAVAVVVDGEPVVDLWGGRADVARTAPWHRDTLVCAFSCTKPVVALAALELAARGELDLDAPVTRYWPEFAAAGKAGVLVRHLLSHTSGVSGWEPPVELSDVYDWDTSTARLAAQAPWWAPGTASAYHAITYGHLIGEVIRRVTGLKPGAFVAGEIAGPLGADFHIGLDPAEHARIAELVPVPPPVVDDGSVDPTSVAVRTFTGPALKDPSAFASSAFRTADSARATATAPPVAWRRSSRPPGRRCWRPHSPCRPRAWTWPWASACGGPRLRPLRADDVPVPPGQPDRLLVRRGRVVRARRPRPPPRRRLSDEQAQPGHRLAQQRGLHRRPLRG